MRGLSKVYVVCPAYSNNIKSDIIKQLKSLYNLICDFNVK